jgi:hypothetical protein
MIAQFISTTVRFIMRLSFFMACAFPLLPAVARGQVQTAPTGPFRSHSIQLQQGWNAVYVEIEPRKGSPTELFQGTPVEIVAAYNRPVTPMQFIESPSEVLPDRKGWNVWYAPHRDDRVLTNLSAIQAHNAYLVFAKTAFTWTFQGTPYFGSARWHPNAYNLVGFPIHAAQAPTVAAFFGNAAPHTPLRVYRMVSGQWSLIANPAQVLMQPGAAYWVYSNGASSFGGSLDVTFGGSSSGGIVFSTDSSSRTIQIRSTSAFPQNLTFSLQAGENGLLPVSYLVRVLELPSDDDKVPVSLASGAQFGPLEAGAAFELELEVAHESVSQLIMASTLVITSNAGSRVEIPLLSIRQDLLPTP